VSAIEIGQADGEGDARAEEARRAAAAFGFLTRASPTLSME